jgi:O-antigen ligase
MHPRNEELARSDIAWAVSAPAAVVLPVLLAFTLPPSATFLNQAASLVGWGAWTMVLAAMLPARPGRAGDHSLAALLSALTLLAAAALASPLWTTLPTSLSWSSAGMVVAAALVAMTGRSLQRSEHGRAAFQAFCIALAVAGVLSTAIGIVQVFVPDWTGGNWIAAASIGGRAAGNLRQPNHLSTLLLWSMVAAVWLGEAGLLKRAANVILFLLLLFGLVLSASRTGMIGAAMLALWGVLDHRLARGSRVMLWLVPVAYVLFWLVLFWLAVTGEPANGHGGFTGETQLHKGDISSSRFAIWSNTLSLIAAHPWFGVGWGDFNFAWSLTPFPDRPTAFFDHTHNLPLQFIVELGIPLATLVLALLAWALWGAFKAARDATGDDTRHLRAAFVMVVMIVVHSQLEYPLWYTYFLLPTAFAFGLCLGGVPAVAPASAPAAPGPRKTRPLLIAAMLLMIGGVASVIDYWRVVVIFAPPEGAAPLSQRILDGRRSWFFGHHADYAAATSVPDPSQVMPAFETATHYLLDTRLMVAWAQALAARGDLDRARHIAARLREFRNPASDEFFEPCTQPADPASAPPFQCQPPTKRFDYRDFR